MRAPGRPFRACLAGAALLLAGCAKLGEGPQPAAVTPPQSFVYAPDGPARASLASLLPAEDPAFQALVASIAGDAPDAPDVQVALARIDAARAALRLAGANRMPSLDGSAGASVTRSPQNAVANLPPGIGFDRTNSLWSLGASASWDADLFGRLKDRQRAAALRLDAADADARAVRLALTADIGRAIIDYRVAEERLAVLDEDLADAAALVRLTGVRVRAGISPGFDQVRAQALESAARAQRSPAEAEKAGALGRLVTLTGRDGEGVAALLGQKAALRLPDVSAVGLPATLLRARPDIVAAEFRLGAANAEVAAAAKARFPQFSISATLGLAAIALGDLVSGDAISATLGGNVAGPLLDFGRIEAQIDGRRADAQEAFALYRKAVFAAIGEGEAVLGTQAATHDRVAALTRQLAIEQDSVNLASQRYRMGLSDFLTVIDAQRQRNVTRQALASARGDAARAALAVYRSFGGSE